MTLPQYIILTVYVYHFST